MAEYQSFPELVAKCVDRLVESGVAALGGLYDLTSQRLVRYAATITRNQHDAEDAVQAALVQVARRLNRFCKADQPWPYLLRMVRNEALLIARRRERWRSSPYLLRPANRPTGGRGGIAGDVPSDLVSTSLVADLPGGSCGVEDLGRDDIRRDRQDSGLVARYSSEPLPIRLCRS